MSASKHTPAPWEVSHGGHGSQSGLVIDEYFVLNRAVADDVAIAADIIDPATGMPSEANARLIAAAPEMLSALRSGRDVLARAIKAAAPDLFETDEDVNEHLTIKRMDAAIARAIGGAA